MIRSPSFQFLARQKRLLQIIFLFLVLEIFFLWRIRFGIDFTDEGYYLSSAWRFHLGDFPAKDDTMSTFTLFAVLTKFFLDLFPNAGLYEVRLLWASIHNLVFAVSAACLAPIIGSFFVVLVAIMSALGLNFLGLMSPSYNTYGADFLILGASVLLLVYSGWLKRFVGLWALLAAVLAALAVVSYPPQLVSMLIVFAALLVAPFRAPDPTARQRFRTAGIAFVAGSLATASVVFVYLKSFDFFRYFKEVYSRASGLFNHESVGIKELGILLLRGFGDLVPNGSIYLLVFGPLILLSLFAKARLYKALLANLFLLLALFVLLYSPGSFTFPLTFVAFVGSVHFCSMVIRWQDLRAWRPLVWLVLLGNSIGLAFAFNTHYYTIFRSYLGASVGLKATLVIVLSFLYWEAMRFKIKAQSALCAVYGVMATILVFKAAKHNLSEIYRDEPLENLTATSDQVPRLKGIFSTPERIADVERLYALWRTGPRTGGTLLCYDDLPLLYFIFEARPGYREVWARADQGTQVVEYLMATSFGDGREPAMVIHSLRSTQNVQAYALDAWVHDHYAKVESVSDYEVLVPKPK